MKRLIYIFILLVLVSFAYGNDVMLEENVTFNPSLSNVTYRMNITFYGLSEVKINETCLTINSSTWCNSSATDIEINISDMGFPIILNLRNTSTTNQSSYIEWSCNKNCNYSILWYNSTNLVDSIYNNTFSLSHNPYLSNLSNFTTYFINLTVWDNSGNSANNNIFNFTTAKTIIPSIIPSVIGARLQIEGDIDAGNLETLNETITYLVEGIKLKKVSTVATIIITIIITTIILLMEIRTRTLKKKKKEDDKKRQIREHVQRSYDEMQRK